MATDALIDLLRNCAPTRDAGARLHVAFSGGLDSTVLLHALAGTAFADLVAVHVHHGLQPVADDWAAHCEAVCRSLQVPLQVHRVQVRSEGQGLEAAARAARYAALQEGLSVGDVLVTAHHMRDQAETLLLNLLRGSGPDGLRGMRMLRDLGPGRLWRPFLHVARERLTEYAERHELRWIEDPHNEDPRFARSFLRAEILPRLARRWPGFEENLARSAALTSESATLLRELAQADIAALAGDGWLPVAALKALSDARRRNLVRVWIQSLELPVPGHEALLKLEADVLRAAHDANPVLAWPGGEFRRHRDRLYAMGVLPPVPDDFQARWDGRSAFELPEGCGVLEPRASSLLPVTVRLARPGDRFRPHDQGRSRTLKNLFQEASVPTWVRERTPLLAVDGGPVWIGGFGWSATASVAMPEIRWRHHLPGAPV